MGKNENISPFSAAMTIVGAVIGAGFASGEEIWAFFGRFGITSLLFVLPLFALLFAFVILAFKSQAKNSLELGQKLFGKYSLIYELLFVFCCFCLLSGMIAGMRVLCKSMPLLYVFAICFVGVLLFFGITGVIKTNVLVLPVLILFLSGVCFFELASIKTFEFDFEFCSLAKIFGFGFLYAAFNSVCSLPVVLPVGEKCKHKCCAAAIACSAVCCLFVLLLLTIIFCLKEKTTMPILQICFEKNRILGLVCIVILLFATITTIFSCGLEIVDFAYKYVKNRAFCVVFVMFLSSLFSIFGFDRIVAFVYPVLGGLGVVVFIMIAVLVFRQKRKCNK